MKKLKTSPELPGNEFLNMFFKIMYNVYIGNGNKKRRFENRPPVNGGRKALGCIGTLALVAVTSLN